jgi:cathepsin L
MKFSALLFVTCLSLASSFIINDPLVHVWESFKTRHGKKYDGEVEEKLRFGIWKSNLKFVEQHNAEADQGKHTFWVAINKFADLVKFSLF